MVRRSVSGSKQQQAVEQQQDNTYDESHSETTSRYEDLKLEIERAYRGDITVDDAEKLAAKFLMAQMEIASELAIKDLDARMKKNGLKTKKATVYMDAATRAEKKPSDSFLDNHVSMDPGVQIATNLFEQADAERESLNLYLSIFKDAHIYFRAIGRGRYE